ncbi:SoxR reducing system RseC family protein [Hydrogenovibrio sp. 3SP14C1]|uniref:SoxR reducing system RseC family protein n=1 Tax=Hydrogenovibrio sp. 3SP14C1 TaxID=3038774 RepID=UPI002417D7ED|nr:SoxR reducing system RseC family protein [Hydrogenovibrio sp. 3SP14C1]MDG4813084.1 SoxR reducing system RseC family protein [Hydrogenovibrio sp. 3SP14C1]
MEGHDLLKTESVSDEGELLAQGRVEKVEKGMAYVSTKRETGCSGCQTQKGCGTSVLAQLFSPKSTTPIQVVNDLGAKEGDEVILSMDESHLIKHSLMGYGVPLLGLFIGAILFQVALTSLFQMPSKDGGALLGGLIGLFLGWRVTKKYYRPQLPVLKKIMQSS